MRLKNLTQIATVNRVPIPNEIMEHFKSRILNKNIFLFVRKLHYYNFLLQILSVTV